MSLNHFALCSMCGFCHSSADCPTDDQVVAWYDSQSEELLNSLPGANDGLTPRQAWNAFFSRPPGQKDQSESLAAPAQVDQVGGTLVPYTHEEHARRCTEAALQGVVLSRQLVQVRKRGVVYCAQICHSWTTPGGVDCWTIDSFWPELARFTVPVHQVRLCGGNGCDCAAVSFCGAVGASFSSRQTAQRDLGPEGVTCL